MANATQSENLKEEILKNKEQELDEKLARVDKMLEKLDSQDIKHSEKIALEKEKVFPIKNRGKDCKIWTVKQLDKPTLLVTSFRTVANEVISTGNVFQSNQIVELFFNDGTSKKHPYGDVFGASGKVITKVRTDILSKRTEEVIQTNEEIRRDGEKSPEVFFTVLFNGEKHEISSKFVN